MLKRSAWQEGQERKARAGVGFMREAARSSNEYSGSGSGFGREQRGASNGEYSEHRMGFFGGRK